MNVFGIYWDSHAFGVDDTELALRSISQPPLTGNALIERQ
jgi:hypothetical protein